MAYRDFTLEKVRKQFVLTLENPFEISKPLRLAA
jgi:hypothetical protein